MILCFFVLNVQKVLTGLYNIYIYINKESDRSPLISIILRSFKVLKIANVLFFG